MPFVKPSPFTPERILNATGDAALAERAAHALAAVRAAGIDPLTQPLDWGLIFECGHTVAGKYGLNEATHEVDPDGTNIMETVAQQLLLLAAVTDPDGGAPVLFATDESTAPILEQRVNLGNFAGWVDRNHPEPAGDGDITAAMAEIVDIIATERGMPELATVLDLADGAEIPIIRMNPYVVALVVASDLANPDRFEDIVSATCDTPIRWIIVSLDPVAGYANIARDYSNATYVALPSQLDNTAEADVYSCLAAGLGTWYDHAVYSGLIPSA